VAHVLDAQIHLKGDVEIESIVGAMDAIDVDAGLVDEWRGYDASGRPTPCEVLANGSFRAAYPLATEAIRKYPDRFASIAKSTVAILRWRPY
jgi:hypothetical protein